MRNLLIAIMAVGVSTGCGAAHRSELVSASPAFGDAQFRADQNACRQQAIGQADKKSVPTWGQTINREAYEDCMRSRGY